MASPFYRPDGRYRETHASIVGQTECAQYERIMPYTSFLYMDEPVIILYEVNRPAPDSFSVRRYRHIQVVRGDAPAEYVEDMGLASDFGDEFCIPGGVNEGGRFVPVERVGDLIDCAEALRLHPFDRETIVPTDLISGYHDVMDQRQRVLKGT